MPPKKKKEEQLLRLFDVFQPVLGDRLGLPFFTSPVEAGFPSPADDYTDRNMDLNDLIRRPSTTFFLRVKGDSMKDAHIGDGDLLIVDRSIPAVDNRIVIAAVNGEFTVKRLRKKRGKTFLVPENNAFRPLEITGDMEFRVWGVVTHVIKELHQAGK